MKSRSHRSLWINKTLCTFALLVLVCTIPGNAQTDTPPLAKDDVLDLLHHGVPSKRISVLAHQNKIDFQVDASTEAELRHAGATNDLIETLKTLAPPPAVTIIVIQSSPGGATVYIDDEPVGTTSDQGRLKLSTVPPGQHRIRISLDGYRDFYSNIDVSQGQETDVDATLESSRPAINNNNSYNNGNNRQVVPG